jgi:hypothetical protein
MDLGFLKNPIILAIIATVITYLYMSWDIENRHKKNPKSEKEQVNLITPAIVGIFVWFLTSSYFSTPTILDDKKEAKEVSYIVGPQKVGESMNQGIKSKIEGGNSENISSSFGSKTYHLIGKNNIKLPQTDVFIDIARF